MTYPVPGYPLYVDGAYYPAAQWRELDGGTAVQDAGSAAAVAPAGGVFGDPAVSMLTAPGGGMSVTVNAGYCSVPNTSGSGAYRFGLMQQATLGPVTAPSSGTRLDYVIAGVNDIGSGSAAYVEYLTGTTSPPALPANAIRLAEVAVPSTATSITSGMITDLRGFVAAPGCIVPVTDAAAAPSGPSGQLFWDITTAQLLYSPLTEVTETLTGSGTWTCPAYVTSVAARAIGGGGGGTGVPATGSPGSQGFASSGSWTAPDGVSSVTVLLWGAGGGGGWTNSGLGGGGGGGGFAGASEIPVVSGNSYTITVGAGGAGGTSSTSSAAGGSTSFTDSSTGNSITAGGGSRGTGSAAGAGGSGTYSLPSSVPVTIYGGGNGYWNSSPSANGFGGGGAGEDGGGGSASNSAPGAGGPGSGGEGGADYAAGAAYGGGGGGGGLRAGPDNAGHGGAGYALLSWEPSSTGGGGGGGGEEAYNPAVAVHQAGGPYAYAVGAGGGDSTSGGATFFTGDSATVLANGGQAASGTATGGAGGTGGTGVQLFDGGAGGTGSAGTSDAGQGGGGGASGSSTAPGTAGGNATATAPGTGGAAGPYGGSGGTGGGGNGSNGAAPGGGGGGSSGPFLGYSGGTGGPGSLVLAYTVAPGAIPYLISSGPAWASYDTATGTVSSVSVTIDADGTSDYEITARAANTGPSGGGTAYGTLRILIDGVLKDSVNALASTGTPAGHYNAGWTYYTSGEQGTTPAQGSHTVEFTSSGITLEGPAFIRVTRVPA